MSEPLVTVTAVSRAFVAFYFLCSAWFNFVRFRQNIEDLASAGIARGASFMVGAGTILMTTASVMFVFPATVVIGGVGLIVFTLGADALYHRWWIHDDRKDRILHQQFACEHLALNAGIAGLIVATSVVG